MPGGFPFLGEICNGTAQGPDTANSRGTAVTGGAANTKGSYGQLIASSAIDAAFMLVCINTSAALASWNVSVDIAVGGAGSEKIIAADLLVSTHYTTMPCATYLIPCSIPAATRLSARCQGEGGSDVVYVSVILFEGGFTHSDGASGVDALGFASATSLGAILDAGATANTKGAYTQLIAATARDYSGLFLSFGNHGISPTAAVNTTMLVDVAIGAAAAEKVIIPNLQIHRGRTQVLLFGIGPLYIPIPSGTRLSARSQASNNTSIDRQIGIVAYGIYH